MGNVSVAWPTLIGAHFIEEGPAKALASLVFFGVCLGLRLWIPHMDSRLWRTKPIRIVVYSLGIAGVALLAGAVAESVTPDVRGVLCAQYLLSATGLVVLAFISAALTQMLSNLQDDTDRLRRRVRMLLDARVSFSVMIGSAVVSGMVLLVVSSQSTEVSGLPAVVGRGYELLANGPGAVYALIVVWVLWDAHRVRANGASLARRWKYLSAGMVGYALEEADNAVFGQFGYEAGSGAFHSVFVGVAFFSACMLVVGAFMGICLPLKETGEERKWRRYGKYKRVLEELEERVSGYARGSEMLTSGWRIEVDLLRYFLGKIKFSEDFGMAQDSYRLIATAREGDRNLGLRLSAVAVGNEEFLKEPEGTEPRRRAESDHLAPVAELVKSVLDKKGQVSLLSAPPWFQAVALVAADRGLLPAETAEVLRQPNRQAISRYIHRKYEEAKREYEGEEDRRKSYPAA